MCGRYFISDEALEAYDVKALNRETGGSEIRPGMEAPVVLAPDAGNAAAMRWGFERERGGLVINARVETMGDKPLFRGLADGQRCAMPASRYYEWRRADRQKFAIDLTAAGLFWLAGLWRAGGAGREFVVLTQAPVASIVPVHNRMPLILADRRALERWFGGETPLFSDSRAIRIAAEGPEQLQMAF